MNFDPQLVRILSRIEHLRQYDLAEEAGRRHALEESLEALRAVTMYRGLLKNAAEVKPPSQPLR